MSKRRTVAVLSARTRALLFAFGIQDYLEAHATRNMDVQVVDLVDGPVQSLQFETAQLVRLEPVSRDDAGRGALLLKATWR